MIRYTRGRVSAWILFAIGSGGLLMVTTPRHPAKVSAAKMTVHESDCASFIQYRQQLGAPALMCDATPVPRVVRCRWLFGANKQKAGAKSCGRRGHFSGRKRRSAHRSLCGVRMAFGTRFIISIVDVRVR